MAFVLAAAVPHPPLIIPSIGRGQEHAITPTVNAYMQIAAAIAQAHPAVLVITSPHAPCYRDGFYICNGEAAQGSFANFGAPEGARASYHQPLAQRIAQLAHQAGIPLARGGADDGVLDHATLIPLWFINNAYQQQNLVPDYQVVRIGISGMGFAAHRTMGACIAQAVAELGINAAFVASGDCSHHLLPEGPYGFTPEGPQLDQQLQQAFADNALDRLFDLDPQLCDQAGECGVRSFQMMAAALDCSDSSWDSQLLAYEGPFGVGYLSALLTPVNADNQGEAAPKDPKPADAPAADPLVAWARTCVESYVTRGMVPNLQDYAGPVTPEMTDTRAGAFVSLHLADGSLRGCIGTICATRANLAAEIAYCAQEACSQDPRFSPVRPAELDYLTYSVDVLGAAEPIPDESSLDPALYGVIVTKGWRRGLLLPRLDGVDTVRQQVDIAKQKAGIGLDEDHVELQRFQVVRHTLGGGSRHV